MKTSRRGNSRETSSDEILKLDDELRQREEAVWTWWEPKDDPAMKFVRSSLEVIKRFNPKGAPRDFKDAPDFFGSKAITELYFDARKNLAIDDEEAAKRLHYIAAFAIKALNAAEDKVSPCFRQTYHERRCNCQRKNAWNWRGGWWKVWLHPPRSTRRLPRASGGLRTSPRGGSKVYRGTVPRSLAMKRYPLNHPSMKPAIYLRTLLALLLSGSATCGAAELFRDDFTNRLADGWSWIREDQSGWRATERGLEVRVQPGNMWGPANNATNVLTRSLPEIGTNEIEIAVTIENRPAEQYEQADLVWYYDDSHMVKLGQELVDGKLSIVMGREQKDKTRTMCIIPIQSAVVHARFVVKGNLIRGEYRLGDEKEWRVAGECDLPVNGSPKASLQVYQGPKTVERWARFSAFSIRTADR